MTTVRSSVVCIGQYIDWLSLGPSAWVSTRTFPFEGWFLFSYLRVMFIPNSAHSNQNVSEKDGKFLSKNHRAKCKNHLRGVCEQTKELSVEFWSKLGPCKSSNPSLPTSDVPPDYNQFHHIEKEPATRPTTPTLPYMFLLSLSLFITCVHLICLCTYSIYIYIYCTCTPYKLLV